MFQRVWKWEIGGLHRRLRAGQQWEAARQGMAKSRGKGGLEEVTHTCAEPFPKPCTHFSGELEPVFDRMTWMWCHGGKYEKGPSPVSAHSRVSSDGLLYAAGYIFSLPFVYFYLAQTGSTEPPPTNFNKYKIWTPYMLFHSLFGAERT